MSLKDIWRREFGWTAICARANRKDALAEAKWELEEWADYGDPALLERAIDRLRGVS